MRDKSGKSYLWLKDLALNTDLGLIHWICVDGCFAEALVLQDPETKYKTRDTLRSKTQANMALGYQAQLNGPDTQNTRTVLEFRHF